MNDLESIKTIVVVGPSALVKEVRAVAGDRFRLRWAAEMQAAMRCIASSADVAAAVSTTQGDSQTPLLFNALKKFFPHIRRGLVIDSCNIELLRIWVETNLASDLIYRPLDRQSLISLAAGRPSPARSGRATQSTPAGRAAVR